MCGGVSVSPFRLYVAAWFPMTSGRSCPLRHVRAGDKRGRQIHHVSRARGSVRLLRTSNISHLAHATPHGSRQARAQVSKHLRGAAPGPRCIAGMIAGSAVSRWPYHDVSRNMLSRSARSQPQTRESSSEVEVEVDVEYSESSSVAALPWSRSPVPTTRRTARRTSKWYHRCHAHQARDSRRS